MLNIGWDTDGYGAKWADLDVQGLSMVDEFSND